MSSASMEDAVDQLLKIEEAYIAFSAQGDPPLLQHMTITSWCGKKIGHMTEHKTHLHTRAHTHTHTHTQSLSVPENDGGFSCGISTSVIQVWAAAVKAFRTSPSSTVGPRRCSFSLIRWFVRIARGRLCA